MKDWQEDAAGGLVIVFAVAIVALATWAFVTAGWQKKAVAKGHAEFYLDASHNRQWRWRTNCVPQPEAKKP